MMEHNERIKLWYNWLIIFIWLVMTAFSAVFLYYTTKSFKIGDAYDPSSESGIAQKIMTDKIPYGGSRIIVLYENQSLNALDPLFKNEVKKSLAGLNSIAFKHQVISPYDNPHQISANKHTAYAVILTQNKAAEISNAMPEFRQALGQPKHLHMYIGGQPIYISDVIELSRQNIIRGERLAIPLSFIALLFIFGGVIAALLPIISSVICITITSALLFFLAKHLDLSILVLNIATMLGLGLGLDYTLLITYRFREELAKGLNKYDAIKVTLSTAGKSIFFSGLAIFISTCSLIFFPLNVLFSMGVGGVIVILVTVTSALTFIPAVLYLLGNKINLFPVRKLEDTFAAKNKKNSIWFIVATKVMKHPFLFFLSTIIFLLCLGYPFLHVKLTRSDADILPSWVESRILIERFNDNFNANELSPINIVFEASDQSILTSNHIADLYDFAHNLQKNPNVTSVASIVTVNPHFQKQHYKKIYTMPAKLIPCGLFQDNRINEKNKAFSPDCTKKLNNFQKNFLEQSTQKKYTVMAVISKYDDNDDRSFNLVKQIRENGIDKHITQYVTGTTAVIMDTIKSSYQLFFKIIIVISLIIYMILLISLRSIVLPLKAIIMNLISLTVCYGMLVYIFQEGHFSWLLNFKPQEFTDLDLPILLFFTLFGLSMDYEVFLLTRMKEFYEKTGDNNLAIAYGLERSARVITSAAIVVIIVSCTFMNADIVFIKAFGLGTALAIAIDVSFVRVLLVPATMKLLGKWNWYLPKWLDRLLPVVTWH